MDSIMISFYRRGNQCSERVSNLLRSHRKWEIPDAILGSLNLKSGLLIPSLCRPRGMLRTYVAGVQWYPS